MMNSNLSMKKDFKEQVKVCTTTTFSKSTMVHICKILLKPNTRVLNFYFCENRKKYTKKMFRVLSCVIYIIIEKLCDYFGSEKKNQRLSLGVAGSYKRLNKKYDNILGLGIPDLIMNLLSSQRFLKNNKCVVILKCPNRIFK